MNAYAKTKKTHLLFFMPHKMSYLLAKCNGIFQIYKYDAIWIGSFDMKVSIAVATLAIFSISGMDYKIVLVFISLYIFI